MPCCYWLLVCCLSLITPLFAGQADSLYQLASARVAAGDSSSAIELADTILADFPEDYRTYLLRGRLRLARGDLDGAREDFRNVLFSSDNSLRALAHVGEGDVLAAMSGKKSLAVKSYRIATQVDPACLEAYHRLFTIGKELNDSRGYRTASGALADLICLDPSYKNLYLFWRDSLFDKTADEINHVVDCVSAYVETHHEHDDWLVGLARMRFDTGDVESALDLLHRAETSDIDFSHVEADLLEARCLLARGDTTGFVDDYQRALDEAGENGDFERLVIETEPIFTPDEARRAAELETAQQWTNFFHEFWKTRDPDPITEYNERLINHYSRLYEAQKLYRNLHPHTKFSTSREYNRMLSLLRLQDSGVPGKGMRPENPMTEYGDYEYDSDLMFGRSRMMNLDQRGLLYVRHGPPDEIRRPDPTSYRGAPPQVEFWRYGNAFFPFRYVFGGGSYTFAPYAFPQAGDIERAMHTDTFEDELPHIRQDAYAANFLGPGGGIELEFYQSIPVDKAGTHKPPQAVVAVFDSTWTELSSNAAQSQLVEYDGVEHFAVVNSLAVPADRDNLIIRFDLPEKRCVGRWRAILQDFPDPEQAFSTSGIVLGDVPKEGQAIHNRLGVDLLPRPDLLFPVSGKIMAYMELYGLKPDPGSGKRSYYVEATISLLEPYETSLDKLFGKLAWWSEKRSGSLTLSFERTVEGTGTGPVPETFLIDTSFLVPGKYKLEIEVQDDFTRLISSSSARFEIAD